MRWKPAALGIVALSLVGFAAFKYARVGDRTPEGILVPTGQRVDPAGAVVEFGGRPVDIAIDETTKRAFVKENRGLTIIDLTNNKVIQELQLPNGASLTGIAYSQGKVYFTSSAKAIHVVDVSGAKASLERTIELPTATVGGNPYPCGIELLPSNRALVALNRDNSLVEVDLTDGKVLRRIPVAAAPFDVTVKDGVAFVTCWGKVATDSELSADSSGTKVAVDHRGIGVKGYVCRVNLGTGSVSQIEVGAQPTGMAWLEGNLLVTASNSHGIWKIEPSSNRAEKWFQTDANEAPNALLAESDRVLVALGARNAVAIVDPKTKKAATELRSAWYPTAIARYGNSYVIASSKGFGSRRENPTRNGRSVYDFLGTLSVVPIDAASPTPPAREAALLARKDVAARPVPDRIGEPSPIEHVVYVLKENRTYDQIFGDIEYGDGDPSLCIYPDEVTPNHHALAREYVLLDNFYCNGVLSADGHSWSTEGNATTYFERAFGGWTRSYPFGDDPLAISSTGHIWDNVLDAGKTFRNYGEYDYAEPANKETYRQILDDFTSGKRSIKFKQKIGIDRLRAHSHPEYPGWNMGIPDVVRAQYFIDELKDFERKGTMPNFSFVYLPQDHGSGQTAGAPTPRAHMADNDLALGRIVEAVSNSKFWPKTAIFVIEDDPQDGFDHIDGHRSICLVISPYAKRNALVSDFYNQTSVLATMQRILVLKPMGKFDAESPLMTAVFQSRPNLTPYKARANKIDLTETNPRSTARALNLTKPDIEDEYEFNKQLWNANRPNDPFPTEWLGAHSKCLAKKGLKFGGAEED